MKVGFIGLGKMGAGICSNIVKNGIDVVVYDINPASVRKFVDMGASSAATVKELAAQVDVCITCVPMPKDAKGVGFVNAPRGGLSHWLRTDADAKIANFQLVVPTTWNLGPRDGKNVPGAAEEALAGTPVADPKRPVEILRVIHSFDPCIACAVHVIDGETNEVHKFKVL